MAAGIDEALVGSGGGATTWTPVILAGGNAAVASLSLGSTTNFGLSLITNNLPRLSIANSGEVTIANLSTGIVHADGVGLLSSSLLVNADVAAGANIADTKLATISTAGKVSNAATTGTASNLPSTLVLRDGAGSFSAGTVTATFVGALTGNVTGSASDNVLKAGDTMTGNLVMSNQRQVRLSELLIKAPIMLPFRGPHRLDQTLL
ncbi:MAG: hypothetical protein HC898_11660 [Phycisphaerales bacterium]|nr:hypothetical protein [Phycisphaerales bacterium]